MYYKAFTEVMTRQCSNTRVTNISEGRQVQLHRGLQPPEPGAGRRGPVGQLGGGPGREVCWGAGGDVGGQQDALRHGHRGHNAVLVTQSIRGELITDLCRVLRSHYKGRRHFGILK